MKKYFLLGLCPLVAHANSWQYQLELSSDNYSDSLPILSLIEDSWAGPYQSGERAVSHSRISISAQHRQWRIGLASRFDYLARYSPDTARLFYLDKNDIAFTPGDKYEVNLTLDHLAANGLFLSWQDTIDSFSYRLQANWWHSSKMTHGKASGEIDINSQAGYQGQLDIDYSYSRDILFNRPAESFSAQGYSLDVALSWQASENWTLELSMIDLINGFHWQNATHTQATASARPNTPKSAPLISGREDYRNFTQRLDGQYKFKASYNLAKSRLRAGINRYQNTSYPWLSYAFDSSMMGGEIQASYFTRNRAIQLGYERQNWGLAVTLDQLYIPRAQTISLDYFWRL